MTKPTIDATGYVYASREDKWFREPDLGKLTRAGRVEVEVLFEDGHEITIFSDPRGMLEDVRRAIDGAYEAGRRDAQRQMREALGLSQNKETT